jgi:hypothetical protein
MVAPITAIYEQENEDWTITVSGLGRELTARAPGIIAARDRTDQLVEKIAPDGKVTVVHLLNGSALEFTAAYMTARLTRREGLSAPLEIPPPNSLKQDQSKQNQSKQEPARAKVPGKQLPKAVQPRKPGSNNDDGTTSKPTDVAGSPADVAAAMPLTRAATPPAARA